MGGVHPCWGCYRFNWEIRVLPPGFSCLEKRSCNAYISRERGYESCLPFTQCCFIEPGHNEGVLACLRFHSHNVTSSNVGFCDTVVR